MKLVVDSNIFISSLDPTDIFHSECSPIFERIIAFEIEGLGPSLVLVETTCAIRRRTNSEEVARSVFKNPSALPSVNWFDKVIAALPGVTVCVSLPQTRDRENRSEDTLRRSCGHRP